MAGLLDLFAQRDPNDPVNMGLLGMSAALGTPVRQGGGVGPAFGAFGQGYQGSQQAEMRRKLMQSQIDENARQASPAPKARFIPLSNGNIFDTENQTFKQAPQQDKPDRPQNPSPEMQLINALYPDPADPQRAAAIKDLLKKKSEFAPVTPMFSMMPFANPAGPEQPPVIRPVNARTGEAGAPVGEAPRTPGQTKEIAAAKNETEKIEMLGSQISAAETLLPKATASGIGTARDTVTQFAGISTDRDDAATQLETIGAWMMANVPRFRGQDSNRDVALYQQMAANVGDRKKTASSRLKALQTLKSLRAKAASQEQSDPSPSERKVRTYDPATGEFK